MSPGTVADHAEDEGMATPRGHHNARLTLVRLLDHCDLALALGEDDETVMVPVERVKQLLLEDFGGDPRRLRPVEPIPSCEMDFDE